MSQARILVVDDELVIRESLAGWLERDGFYVDTVPSGEEALERLKTQGFDIILLDIQLDGISGMEVLSQVKEQYPDIDVIMITAYGSIPSAVQAMKSHAHDYLLKPFDPDELGVMIQKLLEHRKKVREHAFLKEVFEEQTRFDSMIGQSEAMQQIFKLIQDIQDTESTVLITGETGTGKGLAAKAIHSSSRVAEGPFVAVNCGAIPKHIMESELFGHQKGAFTDARETRKGRLEMASGGTLFLDEIGEISMRMQIDLLQVLEDRVFYRVGGTQPLTADFRREVNRGVERISRDAMDELMLYHWPGNVRELSNAIERAVVVCKTSTITPQDLPIGASLDLSAPSGGGSLQEVEKQHIKSILTRTGWHISKAAGILGIDRSTLYNKIKRYDLKPE